jgi:hypothetical protein
MVSQVTYDDTSIIPQNENDIAWLEHVAHWEPCDIEHRQQLTANARLSADDTAWLSHCYCIDHTETH